MAQGVLRQPVPPALHVLIARRRQRVAEGARVIGHKVGLSSEAMQKMMNVDEPDYGHLLDEMQRRFAACPQVQQCYYVTGDVDFMLVVIVPTMADYEAFTRRMFFGNANIKRFRTFVTMDPVKVGLSVPL